VVWDPVDPNTFYFTEWQTGTLYRTNDLGANSYDFDFIGKSTVMMPLEVDQHTEPNPENSYTILYTSMRNLSYPPFKAALVKYSYVDKFEQGYPVREVLHNFYDSLSDIEIAIPGQVQPRFYISTFKSYSNDNNPPDPEFYSGCIYKSYIKDNTRYYQDISKNLLGCIAGFISDIEVNPLDTANIWVSFAEYSNFDPDNPIYKVYTTDDGGSTWESFAKGLPYGIPVFNLKIVPGLHNLYLLCVTDVGVFKNELLEEDEGWYPFNHNLPAKIVTDLEINKDKNTIIASTFGRGLWKTPYRCHYTNEPETLDHSQTWSGTTGNKILDHTIIIPTGTTLTISNCTVYLPSEAKIVVQRGGTLELNGATLTSACNDLWWGIEVQGDSRYDPLNPAQGKIKLTNNAVIEKARKAIVCGNNIEGPYPLWDYTGGIIEADDAIFRNNYYGPMFWNYS
jgi:hypothetical protein